jgi:hypothetical protein
MHIICAHKKNVLKLKKKETKSRNIKQNIWSQEIQIVGEE